MDKDIVRLALKRGEDSETGVPCARDSETEVPEAKLAVPEIMKPESETVVDRVSETGVPGGNSTGSEALSLELFHILAAEQVKGMSVPTDSAHCLKFPIPIGRNRSYLPVQNLSRLSQILSEFLQIIGANDTVWS